MLIFDILVASEDFLRTYHKDAKENLSGIISLQQSLKGEYKNELQLVDLSKRTARKRFQDLMSQQIERDRLPKGQERSESIITFTEEQYIDMLAKLYLPFLNSKTPAEAKAFFERMLLNKPEMRRLLIYQVYELSLILNDLEVPSFRPYLEEKFTIQPYKDSKFAFTTFAAAGLHYIAGTANNNNLELPIAVICKRIGDNIIGVAAIPGLTITEAQHSVTELDEKVISRYNKMLELYCKHLREPDLDILMIPHCHLTSFAPNIHGAFSGEGDFAACQDNSIGADGKPQELLSGVITTAGSSSDSIIGDTKAGFYIWKPKEPEKASLREEGFFHRVPCMYIVEADQRVTKWIIANPYEQTIQITDKRLPPYTGQTVVKTTKWHAYPTQEEPRKNTIRSITGTRTPALETIRE